MECVIGIRRTVDWHKIKDLNHFQEICCFDSRSLRNAVNKWDKDFTVPYWIYRAKLKEIAQKSLKRTGLPIEAIDKIKMGRNKIIIPIDDDDWLHPNISEMILPLFTDLRHITSVFWDNGMFRVDEGHVEFRRLSAFSETLSCGYAVRGDLAKRLWMGHRKMNDYRRDNRNKVHYHLGDLPSMYIRHYGSAFLLWTSVKPLFPCDYEMPEMIPRKFAWCEPYASEVVDLGKTVCRKWSLRML